MLTTVSGQCRIIPAAIAAKQIVKNGEFIQHHRASREHPDKSPLNQRAQ
jgi:hypothetical protein